MHEARVALVIAVVVGAGCYAPTLRDCTVTCAAASDCGAGQVCGTDGFCAAPSIAGRCASVDMTADAAPGDDAMATPPDASLCALGCTNGTCEAGVCVIDCSAPGSCADTVKCPANLPCRVTCGDGACGHNVECGLATSCEIACTGDASCQGEVRCGMAPCTVRCDGEDACARKVKCKDACACDVTCTGEEACKETIECPLGGACRLGEGCSSQLDGCDRCP